MNIAKMEKIDLIMSKLCEILNCKEKDLIKKIKFLLSENERLKKQLDDLKRFNSERNNKHYS